MKNTTATYPFPIIKIRSMQLTNITKIHGQIFYVTDENRMYSDTIDGGRVYASDINILQTESERLNVNPDSFDTKRFYVVETNILFSVINNSWIIERGTAGGRITAQTHYPDGEIIQIYPDDVTTNGIMNNGSVVIRDSNKTITGLLSSNGYSVEFSSLVGNQINLNPSAVRKGNGTLTLNADLINEDNDTNNNNTAMYNGSLYVYGSLHKVSPATWKNRYSVVTTPTVITSTSIFQSGCKITEGSILGTKKYEKDVELTEKVEVSTGSLATGCHLTSDSRLNSRSIQPPFIFDTSESSIIPDYQYIESFEKDDKTILIQKHCNVGYGSELFIRGYLTGSFDKIIINGMTYTLLGEELQVNNYALIKVINLSEFIFLKGE